MKHTSCFSLDLYDGFIESNKKEDAGDRMLSIRAVVSDLVLLSFNLLTPKSAKKSLKFLFVKY